MKLYEIKNKNFHYFKDDQGRFQCENKAWHNNGQQWIICHYKDGEMHGEYKEWDLTGNLNSHIFAVNCKVVINFLKNPESYPTTPEDKTYFALKYGIGDAPFITTLEVK